ncbi:XdhC family protein, partial [Streptomyces sp. MCAF7]
CVEGAVYDLCQDALRTGQTVRESFGYSDEDAFAVGLTCGGTIDILVTPVPADDTRLRPVLAAALSGSVDGRPTALVRIADGPPELLGRALLVRPDGSYEGTLGPALDRTAVDEARVLLEAGRTATVEVGADGGRCGEPV